MKTVLVALFALAASGSSFAHPGHDPVTVSGTLVRVLPDRIDVDTLDTAALQRRTISIVTDDQTKWKQGKKTVTATDLHPGMPVVVAFIHAELKDGTDGLVAREVRGQDVKKK